MSVSNHFMGLSIRHALAKAEEMFRAKNIESERLNSKLLLAKALGIDEIKLIMRADYFLNVIESKKFEELVARRISREPLQYILGETYFYDVKILLDESVLIPRPETEELTDIVINKLADYEKPIALDLCSGSGAIGLAIAKKIPDAKVLLADISSEAIKLSRKSAELNKLQNVEFIELDALNSNYFLPKFDAIISNPPYIPFNELNSLEPEVKCYEPKIALTDFDDGFKFYRHFAVIFRKMLNDKAFFALEIGYDKPEFVKSLFSNQEYFLELKKDFNGIDRFLIGDVTNK